VADYRKAGIRLTENIREDLEKTAYPGPGIEKDGYYARRKQQLKSIHMFDIAHTVMLAEQGIISHKYASAILTELKTMEEKDLIDVRYEAGGGIHSGEQYLNKRLGKDIAGMLHTGRSSGDLNEVSCRITLRERLLKVQDELLKLLASLIKISEEHIDTMMPGYSHLRHAQPTTLAHYLLSWVCVFERDFERSVEIFKRVNQSPAGAAIMGGSDFPINRRTTAELLGFDMICVNTRDAIWNRDYLIEVCSLLAIIGNNISRLADDLQLWSTAEYNMLEIADGYCGTSSIMPQKKNPYSLEYLRAESAHHLANLVHILTVMKAPSDAIALIDLQRITSNIWRGLEDGTLSLKMLKGILEDLKVNKDLMRERAGAHWSQASDLASAMVREKGISWRIAHQITGIMVRRALNVGLKPSEVTSDLIDEASMEYNGIKLYMPEEIVLKALDPWQSIKARQVIGGPAPEVVVEEIKLHHKGLKQKQFLREDIVNKLNRAEAILNDRVQKMLDNH